MWIWLSVLSAFMLGIYDVAKKAATKKNSVMWILFSTTLISAVLLAPLYESGTPHDFAMLVPKAILVTASWISGLYGIKSLPLTISSVIKASRPVFVVLCSIVIFGERLNPGQTAGVVITLASLLMLSRSGRYEGIDFLRHRGVWWMVVSVVSGVASALYDKHIMRGMSPGFVQSYSTLMIAALMGTALVSEIILEKRKARKAIAVGAEDKAAERKSSMVFNWDWSIAVAAVCITLADMAYFHSLKDPDALLSIVSLMRRGCVIVTFVLGIFIFKERNIARKAVSLAFLLCGMIIMTVAS